MHGRYVLVDAASARLYMIEDGRVQDSMRVIVGKPETPTPELKSVINYETLNPYWHVTPDLAKTLIAPRVLQDGDAYLTTRGYEVLSGWGPDARVLSPDSIDWKAVAAGNAEVFVRQRPGPANSLGHFKFDLPNGDGIYLHDTPKKELFAQDQRNLSHGCVRLEDAERLARWLLGKDPPAAAAPEENILLPTPCRSPSAISTPAASCGLPRCASSLLNSSSPRKRGPSAQQKCQQQLAGCSRSLQLTLGSRFRGNDEMMVFQQFARIVGRKRSRAHTRRRARRRQGAVHDQRPAPVPRPRAAAGVARRQSHAARH